MTKLSRAPLPCLLQRRRLPFLQGVDLGIVRSTLDYLEKGGFAKDIETIHL
jgi:hypothetical protein